MQAPLFEKGLQEVACKRSVIIQKQPLQLFYKIGVLKNFQKKPFADVLQNRCS